VWVGPDRPSELLVPLDKAGVLARRPESANVFVWTSGPEMITEFLRPTIEWVQLPFAGIEAWIAAGVLDERRLWTNAGGAIGARVAEHALALVLAAAKDLLRATREKRWREYEPKLLSASTVGLVGAGHVGRSLLRLLRALGTRSVALTRSGKPVQEADLTLTAGRLDDLLDMSDFVVLASPLTRETTSLIGSREMRIIGPNGWLINVARGGLVDTKALVEALAHGDLGGACLDVTDPEPLPSEHPLWRLPNALITPHIANPPATHDEALATLVMENLGRFQRGEPLIGTIDVNRGY
jgi:phosphoglycerate dehydrogenase-like enzyme